MIQENEARIVAEKIRRQVGYGAMNEADIVTDLISINNEELHKQPGMLYGVSYNAVANALTFTTDPIVISNVPLGSFKIIVRLNELDSIAHPESITTVEPVELYVHATEFNPHPHIENNHLCFGDGIPAGISALRRGDITSLARIVSAILRTYNGSSAYRNISEYYGAGCYDCNSACVTSPYLAEHNKVPLGKSCVCGRCVCHDCLTSCAKCSGRWCYDCANLKAVLSDGQEVQYCPDCGVVCEWCESAYVPDHRTYQRYDGYGELLACCVDCRHSDEDPHSNGDDYDNRDYDEDDDDYNDEDDEDNDENGDDSDTGDADNNDEEDYSEDAYEGPVFGNPVTADVFGNTVTSGFVS